MAKEEEYNPYDDPQISQWAKDMGKRTGESIIGLEGWIRSHRPGGLAANPLRIPALKKSARIARSKKKPDPNSSGYGSS